MRGKPCLTPGGPRDPAPPRALGSRHLHLQYFLLGNTLEAMREPGWPCRRVRFALLLPFAVANPLHH